MKRMSLLLGMSVLSFCSSLALAQTNVPDSAIAEIIRRPGGNPSGLPPPRL